MSSPRRRWTQELTSYHWFVLMVACLGWLFDTMDQQLFVLARVPAMRELLATPSGQPPATEVINAYGPYATAIFLLGWASGGLAFGVLGDRIGRARVMIWTILVYSVCTGLSALSVGFWDFALYRFVTGLGVGGEFAVGVALVAEVMPEHARPFALGLLQALSMVGNIAAALISMGLGLLTRFEVIGERTQWRWMFLIGTVPALLALLIRRRLKEPERWQRAAAQPDRRNRLGSYAALFGNRRWRHNAIVGMLLAFAGVVGLWGIGFFSYDLLAAQFRRRFEIQALPASEISGRIALWIGISSIMQNIGGFLGIQAFSWLTYYTGRKPAFACTFLAATLSTAFVFWTLSDRAVTIGGHDIFTDVFWKIPLMGFCQFALFGGYAIYFPELFPTSLRSTGTSWCYNVARLVAAVGPWTFGMLAASAFQSYPEPMRYSGVTMCGIFMLGLLVLPFAPETKGQPLPE